MAMVNPLITAEVYEIEEFPEVSRRYAVSGVPKTIINDTVEFVGVAPEEFVINNILALNARETRP